jgi:type I restriction enzyme, S subunit
LYYFLKLKQKQIYKLQTGGAQPHIYASDLKNIIIYLPKLSEQEKIVEFLNNIKQEVYLLNLSLQSLKEQKKGLMEKLLTGKVRVKA